MIKLKNIVNESIEQDKINLIKSRIPHLNDNNVQVIVGKYKEYPKANYVQIDDISNGINYFSSNPEQMIELGFDMPDRETLLKLPTGRYKLKDAKELLKKL